MRKTTIIAAVSSLALASFASADLNSGQMLTLDQDSDVSVSFITSSAGAKGSLYFLGTESGGAITSAASSDSNALGEFLFSNHGTTSGYSVDIGQFGAGETLHFAYLITNGVSVAPTGELFRSDLSTDLSFFASGSAEAFDGYQVFRFGIEDIRDPNRSDFDYNDVIFDVRVSPAVPAPGAAALAMIGAGFMVRRRMK